MTDYNGEQGEKKSWNHNYAYNRWISNQIGSRKRILDIGCGNGTLALFLRNDDNYVIGIDPSERSVRRANEQNMYSNTAFVRSFKLIGLMVLMSSMIDTGIAKLRFCPSENSALVIMRSFTISFQILHRIVKEKPPKPPRSTAKFTHVVSDYGLTCGQTQKKGLFQPQFREEQAHLIFGENASFHELLRENHNHQ